MCLTAILLGYCHIFVSSKLAAAKFNVGHIKNAEWRTPKFILLAHIQAHCLINMEILIEVDNELHIPL